MFKHSIKKIATIASISSLNYLCSLLCDVDTTLQNQGVLNNVTPAWECCWRLMQPNLYALLVEYTKLKIEHTKRWYKNRFDRQNYELLRLATICRLQTWWWNVYCLCGNFPLLHNSNIARVTIDECTPHFEWCLRLMSANWRHPPPFRWWNKDQACADKPRLLSQIVATK